MQLRLVNHKDIIDLTNGTLTTVRVMSCRVVVAGEEKFEVTNAVFRMARNRALTRVDIRSGISDILRKYLEEPSFAEFASWKPKKIFRL